MDGYFENGSPHVEIEVFGVSEATKAKIKGLIDTGYNGHLTLSYARAFPLGLVLVGIQTATLADGSTSHFFVCLGTVVYGGKKVSVPVDIQPSGGILIGTQLLKKLGKSLMVSFALERVELQDEKNKVRM